MNIIKVKPDKNGNIFVKFYGIEYQIVIDEEKKLKKEKVETEETTKE